MVSPDAALASLKRIRDEFSEFIVKEGPASEADTRVKLIDRILVEVLGWREADLVREPYVPQRGYMDYTLKVRDRRYVTVEAKREGEAFVLPGKGKHRFLQLSGALLTDENVKEAIEQVRSYCDESSIRYAIATNGYSWIVFRAIREDMPWRKGRAAVFASLDQIVEDFSFFWNLLEFSEIQSGSLDKEFGSQLRITRSLHRVADSLFNADQPLQRNRLHTKLLPLISAVFEDIADQAQLEILHHCYVHSHSLNIVSKELGVVISDEIPHFLKVQGAVEIKQSANDAGAFGELIASSIAKDTGHLCLLLGGIGSGKTTFLKRYQRTIGADLLNKHTLWFSVDFLRAPLDPQSLESFVWKSVLEQLRVRYEHIELETRKYIKNIYKSDIKIIDETALKHTKKHSLEYERLLSPFLEKWQSDTDEYVPRLLSFCKPFKNIKIVIFIDNVDQLSPAYQAQIFLLAQRVTGRVGSITIVAMREESYYTASVQKTFTAYTNHRFHIASPQFFRLIRSRIDYSRNLLDRSQADIQRVAPETDFQSRDDMSDFLKVVEDGLLKQSRVILHFIEALCFGNMRLALQMFTTFLSSGTAEVDKMLRIYRRDGSYFIAYHEFVKAIMLGDRKYYKETASPIMNIFDCGIEKNSSHFTALRLVALLSEYRGQISTEGRGYFDIGQIIYLFEDIFDNREDVIRSLTRLVQRQLVEVNTRSTESIRDASHARLTSSGWYYLNRLVESFVYLDLVLQDTPLNDIALMESLRNSVYKVNNLSDPDEDKIPRMEARFQRVDDFLKYLSIEEESDFQAFGLERLEGNFHIRFMPNIRESFEEQRARIMRRITEHREKYMEDTVRDLSESDVASLESLLEERTFLDDESVEEDPR